MRSKFAEGLSFDRPSSCPPVQRHQREVVGDTPTVSPNDVRLTKSYYEYYYSFSHARNPRLPKPLIDWSLAKNGGSGGGGAGGGSDSSGDSAPPNFGGAPAAFPRAGQQSCAKQQFLRRDPRSPHSDFDGGVAPKSPPASGDSPPGAHHSPKQDGKAPSVGSGGDLAGPMGSASPASTASSGLAKVPLGSEHSADSTVSPRFGSHETQPLRRHLDGPDSLESSFQNLSLSSSDSVPQVFDPSNHQGNGFPPFGGPGGGFDGPHGGPPHHAGPRGGPHAAGPGGFHHGGPPVPHPHHGGPHAGPPGPLLSPGGMHTPTGGAPGFWNGPESPNAADNVPLSSASTADLLQQLAIRNVHTAGGGAPPGPHGPPHHAGPQFHGGEDVPPHMRSPTHYGGPGPQFGAPNGAFGGPPYGGAKGGRYNNGGRGGSHHQNGHHGGGGGGGHHVGSPASAGASGGASLQSLLLKGNNSKIDMRYLNRQKFTLMDIVRQDLVASFSKDQHGSRLIQQKIQKASPADQDAAFAQVEPVVLDLCLDIYGNYVVQKYFEHGQEHHKQVLMSHMAGHILELSVDVFGCRVVQKGLENVEPHTRLKILAELTGNVHRCVLDQNANHVLQKCIQVVESRHMDPIVDVFEQNTKAYCQHSYGCRIMQRLLTYCTYEQTKKLLDEICKHALDLSVNEYGNYVVQHVLKNGAPEYKKQVIDTLMGHVLSLSRHKFASNVIEKCFEFGTSDQVSKLISEISDNDSIAIMVGDQYANYVVQKILDFCNVEQKIRVLKQVMAIPNFHKVAFGKHIIFAVDKLRASLRDRLGKSIDFPEQGPQ